MLWKPEAEFRRSDQDGRRFEDCADAGRASLR
jgi:hypothetical protein